MNAIFENLPEPPKVRESNAQRAQRGLQFARVLNAFVLAYHLLHKFVMPLLVEATANIPVATYHGIDWWWSYHAIIAVLLLRKNWQTPLLVYTIYVGFGGMMVQVAESLLDNTWYKISLWLTAASTLAVLLYLTKIYRRTHSLKFHILCFFFGTLLGLGAQGYLLNAKLYARLHGAVIKPEVVHVASLLGQAERCGVKEFSLKIFEGQILAPELSTHNQFVMQNCGFPFTVVMFDPSQDLHFENASEHYVNVKFNRLVDGRWQPVMNQPLRQHHGASLPVGVLTDPIHLVFSDARSEAGVMVLVSKNFDRSQILQWLGRVQSEASLLVFDRFGIEVL